MGSDVRRDFSETRSVHEAFVELVQQDDDLMRAEFDALIDACWHRPPPPPPARPQPVPRPPLWPDGPLVEDLFVPVDDAPEGTRWGRQRAPPAVRDVPIRSVEGR